MAFNSIIYFAFFIGVVGIYFSIPHRFRWMLLLSASFYFYMCWRVEYVVLLIFSITLDYICGLRMGSALGQRSKRFWLILSLCGNLGLLFAFKYFNFMNHSVSSVFHHFDWPYSISGLNILLPIGISFYTFQSLSYTIDVYRGERKPETHLGIFALYVSFFPQLVAGPIERAGHLLPQFREKKEWDFDRASYGVKRIVWGLFKKVVIADRLAVFVNAVYNNPSEHNGWTLLLATYCFAFQIYCDFSGYTDIAIGSARVLGFKLMENFRLPYFATSMTDFWRRWHISLSTWLRDYLYIPLGGNRKGKRRIYINLLITMILGGLWHGANWTFLIWGAIHGVLLMISKMFQKRALQITEKFQRYDIFLKAVRILITFHLVCFAWIFFRANSVADAFFIIQSIGSSFLEPFSLSLIPKKSILILVSLLLFIQWLQRKTPVISLLSSKPVYFRWPVYYLALFGIILYGVMEENPFIYFQF